MEYILTVVALCSVMILSNGTMEGELIQNIDFYQKFASLESLRCSKAYGRGTQPNKLVSYSEDNVQAVRRSLTTDDEETFLDQLRANDNHDIGVFTPDELRRLIVYVVQNLDFSSRQRFVTLSVDWDSIAYSTATSIVTTWSPDIYLLMKDQIMCEWIGKMDEAIFGHLCGQLAKESLPLDTVLEFLDRCAYCVGIAVRNKENDTFIGTLRGSKATVFEEKLNQIYPTSTDRDIHQLMLVPDAVTEVDIDMVPDTQFCNQDQMSRLVHHGFYDHVTRGVKLSVADRIRKCINTRLSEWSDDNLVTYAKFIIHLPPETLKDEFSGAMDKVASNIEVFTNVTDILDSEFFQSVAWMIKEYWTQASTGLSEQTKILLLCVAIKFAPEEAFFDVVSHDDFQTFFEKRDLCESLKLSQEELSRAIEHYVTTAEFKWTDAIFGVLGPIMGDVRRSVLISSGHDSLCQHWVSFKDTPFHTSIIMAAWETCSTYYEQLDTWECAKIKTAGSFLTMLTKSELATIPGSALSDCVEYVEQVVTSAGICKSNPAFCDEIVTKITDHTLQAGNSLSDAINKLGPTLTASVDNFNENDLSLETLNSVHSNHELASSLWKLMKTTYGEVATDNVAYTSAGLSDKVVVVAEGSSMNDFLKLPEDDGFFALLSNMESYISLMSGKKKEVILAKLRGMFGIYDNEPGIVCIDSAIAQEVGVYFSRASVLTFKKLKIVARKAILKAIGQNYDSVRSITPHKMRTLTMIMLKTEGIEKAKTYTKKHIDSYGPYMWCGMKKDHAQKLSTSALTKYHSELSKCVHFDSDTRRAIVLSLKTHLESSGSSLYDRLDIVQTLGHFLPDVADTFATSEHTKTQTDRLVSTTRNIFSKISQFLEEISSIDENVISLEERQKYTDNVNTLAKRLYTLALDGSGSVSCKLLQDFRGQFAWLNQDFLQDLSTTDAIDCLPEFQIDTFPASVSSAILVKVKKAEGFGEASAWSSGDIARAGKLLDGLSSGEIEALTFTEQVIAAINHIYFSKSSVIINAYLADMSVGETSSLRKDTLSLMGTLLCGYTVSQLTSMDQDAVYNAARDVCHITCLTSEQLQAFGGRISAHVGSDWSTVDPQTVASLGVCMGGLPSTDLNTLNLEQIGSLQPIAIKNIPADVFSEVFDSFKLAALSSDQANVVTDQQRSGLSSGELSVLNSRTTLEEEDTSIISSGGSRSQCGIAALTIIVFLVTLRGNM